MNKIMKTAAAFVLLQSISLVPAYAESIEIAAIDWCPQLCPNENKSGYIMDIVKEVYKDSEFHLSVKYYPWSRAVGLVKSGRAHVLLSPTKDETPDLLFPKSEVGIQKVCFFTKSDSSWSYTGIQSLDGLKVAAYKDGAFGEIDNYMKENAKQFQLTVGNSTYLDNNLKKMNAGRIDAVLYTKNSTASELAIMGVADDYREAGCVTEDKLYAAFTPESGDSNVVQSMMDVYDKRMVELKSTGKIAEIMKAYNMEDWSNVKP